MYCWSYAVGFVLYKLFYSDLVFLHHLSSFSSRIKDTHTHRHTTSKTIGHKRNGRHSRHFCTHMEWLKYRMVCQERRGACGDSTMLSAHSPWELGTMQTQQGVQLWLRVLHTWLPTAQQCTPDCLTQRKGSGVHTRIHSRITHLLSANSPQM